MNRSIEYVYLKTPAIDANYHQMFEAATLKAGAAEYNFLGGPHMYYNWKGLIIKCAIQELLI